MSDPFVEHFQKMIDEIKTTGNCPICKRKITGVQSAVPQIDINILMAEIVTLNTCCTKLIREYIDCKGITTPLSISSVVDSVNRATEIVTKHIKEVIKEAET
jgi:hypothetical protein